MRLSNATGHRCSHKRTRFALTNHIHPRCELQFQRGCWLFVCWERKISSRLYGRRVFFFSDFAVFIEARKSKWVYVGYRFSLALNFIFPSMISPLLSLHSMKIILKTVEMLARIRTLASFCLAFASFSGFSALSQNDN